MRPRKVTIAVLALAALGGIIVAVIMSDRTRPVRIKGVVLVQNKDFHKQIAIADVEITATNGMDTVQTKSDSTGYFQFTLPRRIELHQPITMSFRRPGYRDVTERQSVDNPIEVVRMASLAPPPRPPETGPETTIANVRVRYMTKATTVVNVGSGVETFAVINTGDVPCNRHAPCSPDGRWQATIGGINMDAGEGNEFRNARLSCIAGPCPFTRIISDRFSAGGRHIGVSILDWSDSTSFTLEAEVVHPMVGDVVGNSYPVIMGRTLNFTLPPTAQGPSIEADVRGTGIVFPLGPALRLSWADCSLRIGEGRAQIYRCELKPGYRF